MSYQFYLILHLVSLFVVLTTLGGIVAHVMDGGSKQNFLLRKPYAILHGIFLLVVFVSGFGLMAKAQYTFSSSQWLYGKLFCWALVGVLPTLLFKNILPKWSRFTVLIAVFALAAYMAIFNPF